MAEGDKPPPGLYELLVTAGLDGDLADLADALTANTSDLHPAEAADRIALHVARQVERAVAAVPDAERSATAVEVARALLRQLGELIDKADTGPDLPIEPGTVLRSITATRPDGSPQPIDAALIPLLDTTLLTNAPGEPRVGHQLRAEIDSANHIDVVMAFIRTSGINPLKDALRRHCEADKKLRILTTTYTGSTQRAALDTLVDLGAEVRVSYDLSSTRLHAQAWLFGRPEGFSTVYIGSSNLTHQAQVSGLEWNVRVSGARNPDVVDKVRAEFDSYWEDPDFRAYDPDEFDERPEATPAAWAVIDVLPAHPVITVAVGVAATGRSKPAVNLAMEHLSEAGVLVPVATGRRNRSWGANGLLDLVTGSDAGQRPDAG